MSVAECSTDPLKPAHSSWKSVLQNITSQLHWLQVEMAGQLSGLMAELVGGLVQTVGEEPELESEDFMEQHEEEEEELTKVRQEHVWKLPSEWTRNWRNTNISG